MDRVSRIGCSLLAAVIVVAPAAALAGEASAPVVGWVDVTGSLAAQAWGPGGVAVVAAAPDRDLVVAGIAGLGLWASSDGGGTWARVGAEGGPMPSDPYQVVFDPRDGQVFWATSTVGPGLFTSRDAGATLTRVGKLEGVAGLSIDAADAKRKVMLAGLPGVERGVQRSSNGGNAWSKVGGKLPAGANPASDVLLVDPKTLLASLVGPGDDAPSGIFRSADAGMTWTKVSHEGGHGPGLVGDDGTLYWSTGTHLLRSTDRGVNWTRMKEPAEGCPVQLPRKRLLAVGGDRLLSTTDAGRTWQTVCPPLPFPPAGMAFSPTRRCLYAWRVSERAEEDVIVRLDLPADLALEDMRTGLEPPPLVFGADGRPVAQPPADAPPSDAPPADTPPADAAPEPPPAADEPAPGTTTAP